MAVRRKEEKEIEREKDEEHQTKLVDCAMISLPGRARMSTAEAVSRPTAIRPDT